MNSFFTAIVLAIVMESLCMALFPKFMRKAMLEIATRSDQELRSVGATGLVLAVLLAFLLRAL